MATTFLSVKNRAQSKLAAAIDSDDLSLAVTAGEGANFPSTYPFDITIEDEILTCTNRSTDTLTVTRSSQSTTAAAHPNKAYVALNVTAKSMSDLNTTVNTIEATVTGGEVILADDKFVKFGTSTDAQMGWETKDANANALIIAMPVGTSVNVPVMAIGDAGIIDVDLGFFNGITLPTVAVLNIARDAYVSVDSGDVNASGKGIYFKAAADEDIKILSLSVGGTPAIFWDESEDRFSVNKGFEITAGKVNHANTFASVTGNEYGYQLTITDATIASADMHRGLVVSYTASGNKTGTSDIEGISVDMFLNGNTITAYPMAVYLADSGNKNHDVTAGYTVYIENLGSGTLGNIMGMDIGLNATNLATGRHTGIRIRSHSGTPKSAIDVESAFLVGIDFYNGQTAGNFTTADIRFHHGATLLDDGTNLTLAGARLVSTLGATTVADDILFSFGTSNDIVFLNRSTILAANTPLTNVLIGTPVAIALAANSLIISDVTASGDIALYVNNGGNSKQVFLAQGASGDVAILAPGTFNLCVAGAWIYAVSATQMTFLTGYGLVSGSTNGNTLVLKANDTTFITLTTGATDVCELDGCTLDSSVAKGTWTASGTWTIPAVTLAGTLSANGQVITGLASITGANAFTLYNAATTGTMYISAGTNYDTGAALIFYGAGAGGVPGWFKMITPDAAGTTGLDRFYITGNVAIATITYANATVTGLVLSGFLDAAANYMSFTEMATPGAGAANTARVYAVVGGDTLTDLAAVFQDGTVDIFAQEATNPDSPIFQFPDMTELRLQLRKPDRKTVQFAAIFPDGREFIMRELRYPNPRWN